jgi:hypothetical protein
VGAGSCEDPARKDRNGSGRPPPASFSREPSPRQGLTWKATADRARSFGPSDARLTEQSAALLLPMAMAYGVLHFGKPVLESLTSVLGGWLLGAAVLRRGHIWGGVVAHVSIAALMELFAYLQWFCRHALSP